MTASEIQQLYLFGGGCPYASNVRAQQRSGTKLVDIWYDLSNPSGNPLSVSLAVSTNNGATFNLPVSSLTGDVGSSVTPGSGRRITWDAGADWNNKYSTQVKFRITASGTLTADSPAVTVDTRNVGNRPVVQDVSSAYCSHTKHAYFLNGVSLNQTFTVNVNWNGKTPGSIKFISPAGTLTGASQTYNVGTDFGVGGRLKVKAVASDGTESVEYPVNFDIIDPPPLTGRIGNLIFVGGRYAVQQSSTWPMLDEGTSSVPNDDSGNSIPGCTGKPLLFSTTLSVRPEIDLTGAAKFTMSLAESSPNWNILGVGVSPRVYGGFEGQWQSGWSIGGFGGMGLTLRYQSPPFYWPGTPLYGKWGVSLDQAIEGHIKYDAAEGLYLNGQFPGNCILELAGGVGIDGVTDLEVFVGGGPYWVFQWPEDPTLERWGIKVRGGIRWQVFLYKDELAVEHIWTGSTAGQRALLNELGNLKRRSTSKFTLLPRDYLKKRYALFTADMATLKLSPVGALGVLDSSTVTPIQQNVFPYSQPALGVNGEHRLLLWIWDNPERSAENRTELIWSRWQGGTWSNPTSVWNEATADFGPSVKVFGDGSAIAAWQNEASVLPEGATLDDALAGLEIAVAQFDPVTGNWLPTNLTSNAYLDRSPQLAAGANGQALLTWISNPSNSVLGASNAMNTIHSRLWDGSAWQDPGDIATGVRMLLWSTIAFDGTNGVFLAAIDGDDDQSTPDDQELWGATFADGAWSAFTQLTTNAVSDTKPQAVFDSTGRLLVVWHQGSNVVMRTGDLNLANAQVVGTIGGTSAAKDFTLVTGPAGQISIVWEDLAADGSGPDPMLLNYDPTFGVWSQPVRLLTNTNQLERSFSGAYADNGALLLAYNRVDVTPDTNGVPQFGQVDLMFLDYLIGSDLAIHSGDITLSTNAVPGETVNILALVRNIGELAATNVAVAFYDGNPGDGGTQIGATQTVPDTLPAGSNATVQVEWTVPNTESNRTIYVVIDPSLEQDDRNRANNTAMLSVLAPDLQISDITVLQPNTTNRVINARCINAGTIPSASPVEVTFRRGSPTGTVVATVPISMLPVDGAYDASFEWNMTGLTFTTAFEVVYAKVDSGNLVAESDEDNNTRIVQVMTTLDTDNDGLLDGEESRYGTQVNLWDTDGDGLSDGAEVNIYKTDPTKFDTDGDGLPDGWEVTNGLNPLADDAQADADGDGQTNLQEYLAGTNPRNGTDALRVTALGKEGTGGFVITWRAVPGKTYKVLYADSPGGPWQEDLPDSQITAGTGQTSLSYTDTTAGSAAKRFYRIRLVP